MYYVLDERGKEISHNWESSLGVLLGFSGTFMVFRKTKCIILMMRDAKKLLIIGKVASENFVVSLVIL